MLISREINDSAILVFTDAYDLKILIREPINRLVLNLFSLINRQVSNTLV